MSRRLGRGEAPVRRQRGNAFYRVFPFSEAGWQVLLVLALTPVLYLLVPHILPTLAYLGDLFYKGYRVVF